MTIKQSDDQFIGEIAQRMAQAIKRSFTMDHVMQTPKKEANASAPTQTNTTPRTNSYMKSPKHFSNAWKILAKGNMKNAKRNALLNQTDILVVKFLIFGVRHARAV